MENRNSWTPQSDEQETSDAASTLNTWCIFFTPTDFIIESDLAASVTSPNIHISSQTRRTYSLESKITADI